VKAEARVALLLRTLDDARVAWEANAAGGGALLMPSTYHQGSYRELERSLIDMRDNGHRREWWHATGRYRLGESRLLTVPIRRLRSGPRPVLPERSELVAWAGPISGEKTARVRVYVWHEDVDQALADEGVRLLVKTMYGGDAGRIQVPRAIWEAVVGRESQT
jgi:hypothetical protein